MNIKSILKITFIKKLYLLSIVSVLLTCFAAPSQAAIVQWNLINAVLDDGQTLTGGFDHDRDTNTYSNISIANSGSQTFPSKVFTNQVLNSGNWLGNKFDDGSSSIGDFTLSLYWNINGQELTNAGGTVDLRTDIPAFFFCTTADCSTGSIGGSDAVYFASGSLTTVPIPAGVWLFGSGLLGLVSVARRKTNT